MTIAILKIDVKRRFSIVNQSYFDRLHCDHLREQQDAGFYVLINGLDHGDSTTLRLHNYTYI
ncbi:hypothetical protein BDB00DRAFT_819703 [Zychaea mexicana]|uniref:uncharacterized protein n=1 Tax=Zychaea mexicana TaxID=64656 RepID=UPI0022FEBD00|nr:uncharacterized protein BDB00DRAFT_819703 [Zychaea mexicana]KAI9494125.1 hypothetical protein BDB00DRAFT_819703 [Zychaea mexicana]